LTAPAVRPATIRFWNSRTRMISGIEIATDAADCVPSGTSNSDDPVNCEIATGAVRAATELVSVVASRNSFHAAMNVRMAVVARPGAASGTTTLRNASKCVAPSTSAASSRSFGISLKNDTRM
jgi:hypothetical protein